MRIPISFMLFGEKITVEQCDALLENDDCVGQALYRKNKIQLQRSTPSIARPTTHIEVSFCHELVHWIFKALDEDELRKNEQLVECVGKLLHQALTTAEYDEAS